MRVQQEDDLHVVNLDVRPKAEDRMTNNFQDTRLKKMS